MIKHVVRKFEITLACLHSVLSGLLSAMGGIIWRALSISLTRSESNESAQKCCLHFSPKEVGQTAAYQL